MKPQMSEHPQRARRLLAASMAAAAALCVIGASIPAAAAQHGSNKRAKTQTVNPRVCPPASVIASAFGIQITKVTSAIQTGPSNSINTCDYFTPAGRAPSENLVTFLWPVSSSEFSSDRSVVHLPSENVAHLGTAAYALKSGGALWALSGNVQLDLDTGGTATLTEAHLVALAKKIL
jgi:hypothetical protein